MSGLGDGRLRPEVRAFAEAMEAKLRENDHKGGWKDDAASRLLRRLEEELDELRLALYNGSLNGDDWRSIVLREAADVGNFAMMLADVAGGLVYEDTAAASPSEIGEVK